MGFLRSLAIGALQGALDGLQKAGGFPPPRSKGPPKDGEGKGGDGPPEPPPPPPPARDLPEPVVGTGPTLAAPAEGAATSGGQLVKMADEDREPKSLQWDPYAMTNALGYKESPRSLTYDTLYAMSWQCVVPRAIIQLRKNQVAAFAEPQRDKFQVGCRVGLRNPDQKPTAGSEKMSQSLMRWIMTTGTTENPAGRDNFSTFLQKITQDSLIYDQFGAEIVPGRNGKPAAFYAIDARTLRLADQTKLHIPSNDRSIPRYVQVYDGLVHAQYTSDELMWGIRNPTGDIRNNGYGQSELEMMIFVITSLLYGMDYNQRAFSQGTSIKGIINFKGAVPEKQLKEFRQHWYLMASGATNAFRTPIVNADEMQWMNMQMANRDMEYNAWMDWLIKIACAIYCVDPMEINFKYGDSGSRSMFESNNQSKLAASKDKGLNPLLKTIAASMNSSIIWNIDEDFVFEFVGIDAQTPTEQADLNTKLVKTIKTVNECRVEEKLPPLPNGLGDVILDPVWMQHMQLAQAAQQLYDAAQHANEGGEGGDDGEGEYEEVDGELDEGGDGPKAVTKDDVASIDRDTPPERQVVRGALPPKREPVEKARTGRSTLKKAVAPPTPERPALVIEVDV